MVNKSFLGQQFSCSSLSRRDGWIRRGRVGGGSFPYLLTSERNVLEDEAIRWNIFRYNRGLFLKYFQIHSKLYFWENIQKLSLHLCKSSTQSPEHRPFLVYCEAVSILRAWRVADTVAWVNGTLTSATSRSTHVNKYRTLGRTVTDADGAQRPGTKASVETADDTNLEASSVNPAITVNVYHIWGILPQCAEAIHTWNHIFQPNQTSNYFSFLNETNSKCFDYKWIMLSPQNIPNLRWILSDLFLSCLLCYTSGVL